MNFVDLTGDDDNRSGPALPNLAMAGMGGHATVRIEVHGKPKPLPRMRHWRNGFWNPAGEAMSAFRVQTLMQNPACNYGVVFGRGVAVVVTIHFYMRRPNSDFRRGDRFGGLRDMVARFRPIRPDIDNLAKFVLDGLNGLVYTDDSQVVKLVLYKLMDSEGQCNGRTVVEVSLFNNWEFPAENDNGVL